MYVLPMCKQFASFHVAAAARAVSWCRCVQISTLERDTGLSTLLARAGWRLGGWFSSPLCSIWPMGIKVLFINRKDYIGLKATTLPDLCMAESHCVPRGQSRDLWSRSSTMVPLNTYPLSLTHAGFASMVISGYVVSAAQAKWCGFCSLWILSCLRS